MKTLSQPRVGKILFSVAILSSLAAVALSAATYFGIMPNSELPVVAPSSAGLLSPIVQRLTAPPARPLDGNEIETYIAKLVGVEPRRSEIVPNLPVFDREAVLNDDDSRMSDDFQIPETLRARVGFWFDVYTKYDANRRIIHHSRFPWIVYKVIDVTDIINAPLPAHRWLRNVKADKAVKIETLKITAALRSLANRKNLKNLNEAESEVARALAPLGEIRKAARLAVHEVRVQTGQRNFFVEGLEVSPRYLGSMEKIFKEKHLPIELTRIPFVESSFNKRATSKVGATGIWQFMGNTGRKFMIVNGSIDERRSPYKATEAAARLLKENHLILFHSWPLAVTAWNHGPSGIKKASKAAGSKDLGTIVSRYHSKTFDFASSNFYSEFLAALYAERYHDKVFGPIARQAELDIQAIRLPRAVRMADVIRVSGLSKDEFLALNPDLLTAAQQNSFLPAGFRLHIPSSVRSEFERNLATSDERKIPKSS